MSRSGATGVRTHKSLSGTGVPELLPHYSHSKMTIEHNKPLSHYSHSTMTIEHNKSLSHYSHSTMTIEHNKPLPHYSHSTMAIEHNKSDAKLFTHPSSPISTLHSPGTAITNTTTSSSGSSGSLSGRHTHINATGRSQSSDLSGSSDDCTTPSRPRPRQSRSCTNSNSSSNVLPAGNICPSGKLGKPGMMARTAPRRDVLGSGTGNYGHGSVMRAAATAVGDAEEVTKAGNEQYKRGQFMEALQLYDQAVAMCPDNAACRCNRAAALTGLGRIGEAVEECKEAVRLDPSYGRAHQRLAALLLRLGQVENARRHHDLAGRHPDSTELHKMQTVERHLRRCEDLRSIQDWKSALREADAAIAAGADSSPLIIALRAEALLRLHQLDEANSTIANASRLEAPSSSSQTRSFGMLLASYTYIVRAQVEMALGRFENAVLSAEKALRTDPRNAEVVLVLHNVKSVAKARNRGNEFFKSGNYLDACIAYGEGLRYDPSNPVLHCNRAACHSKLGHLERSIDDCNEALRVLPSYTKALLRRAASNAKLGHWVESVRDYEFLRKELPGDTEVAEALFHAQVALKTSRAEELSNMKFGGEVEQITGRVQFKSATSSPGVSIVYFVDAFDQNCVKTTEFVDSLCTRYPSLNFMKVNIRENLDVAKDENVWTVPTFKIFKNGTKVKEMIHPSHPMLEYSVRHYGT